MSRFAIVVVALFVVAAACADEGLLANLGDRSRDAVHGTSTPVTTIVTQASPDKVLSAVSAADVVWFNDGIGDEGIGEPSFTIAVVWGRRTAATRFIQASRTEIAGALPGVSFPRLVPEQVGWVTSQLVFDTASGTLDADTSAAFGLWQVEPYSVDEGRVAVLRVGRPTDGDPEVGEIRPDVVQDGLSLTWVQGSYRYELFCRALLAEELCWRMAETSTQLVDLVLPAT